MSKVIKYPGQKILKKAIELVISQWADSFWSDKPSAVLWEIIYFVWLVELLSRQWKQETWRALGRKFLGLESRPEYSYNRYEANLWGREKSQVLEGWGQGTAGGSWPDQPSRCSPKLRAPRSGYELSSDSSLLYIVPEVLRGSLGFCTPCIYNLWKTVIEYSLEGY